MVRVGALLRLAGAALLIPGATGCGAPPEGSPPTTVLPTTPFQRVFGPAFPPMPPAASRLRIDGALLARDRGSLVVSFVGGKAYDPTNPCSTDYGAWAGVDGDTLSVQVSNVAHPKPVGDVEGVTCTMEGYGYLFTLALPDRFTGSTVIDLASGPLWIAPPETVAELTVMPPDWQLTSVTSERSIAELHRTYQPRPGVPGDAGRFMALHQAFGGPTSNAVDAPIANGTIHGAIVPIGRNGDGYAAGWVAGSDHFWFTVVDPAVTLDAFLAVANGVEVRAP